MTNWIWQTLAIEPTSDTEQIRDAWHHRLERADDERCAEELRRINDAYISAQTLARCGEFHSSDLTSEEQNSIHEVLVRTACLLSHTAQMHKQCSWEFIHADPHLIQPEYRRSLGNRMFRLFDQHNQRFRHRRDASHHIPEFIFRLCGTAYGWDDGTLDPDIVSEAFWPNHILHALSDRNADTEDDRPHHIVKLVDHGEVDEIDLDRTRRVILMSPLVFLMTLIIDSLIVMVLPFVIHMLFNGLDFDLSLRFVAAYWVVFVVGGLALQSITDSGPRQASPAKRLLDYMVTDAEHEPVSLKASLRFNGLFAICFVLIFTVFSFTLSGLSVLLAALIFVLFSQRLLNHDDYQIINLTKTAVYDLPHTRTQ